MRFVIFIRWEVETVKGWNELKFVHYKSVAFHLPMNDKLLVCIEYTNGKLSVSLACAVVTSGKALGVMNPPQKSDIDVCMVLRKS